MGGPGEIGDTLRWAGPVQYLTPTADMYRPQVQESSHRFAIMAVLAKASAGR